MVFSFVSGSVEVWFRTVGPFARTFLPDIQVAQEPLRLPVPGRGPLHGSTPAVSLELDFDAESAEPGPRPG